MVAPETAPSQQCTYSHRGWRGGFLGFLGLAGTTHGVVSQC